MEPQIDDEKFIVLINSEEQYSLWKAYLPIPKGWRQVGEQASKEECLKYIAANWTDMRPLSLRRKMDGAKQAAINGHKDPAQAMTQ